jgi:phosphoglycerol transferase MdoB-like AlkP superfamily enzyme
MTGKKLYILKFVILPLALLLLTELVQRGSILSVLKWPIFQPAEFLAGYLLAWSFWAILLALTNRFKLSLFVLLAISVLFALISNTKQKFLGEPLLPWDFVLGKETTNIIYYFSDFINLKLIFFLVGLVVLGVVLFRYVPSEQKLSHHSVKVRLALLALALVMISSVYVGKPLPLKQALDLKCITWDQKLNNSMNGLYLAFLTNIQWLSIEQPSNYLEESISGIVQRYGLRDSVPADGSSTDKPNAVKPNIIMIMNEAFWDPTLLPGVTFNQDPLSFVHSLQEKNAVGSLLVPVYGGGTVNTEFEVLTGHTTNFLPGGSIAYSQYVRRPLESLASILVNQGYTTTAIHSYHNWFYRRDEVYHNLGFDKFISSEFFIEPQVKRFYISDHQVSQLIIEESQKAEQEKEPLFIFAVTMQNHGPYVVGYEQEQIKVEGDISAEAKRILEIYAQGAADADQSLQMLVEHFAQSDRPTLIVFFGDHLPALGENYQVYQETGYFEGDLSSYEEYKKMYTVPLVMWSNYLPDWEEDLQLTTSFMTPYLLQQTGLQGSFYTDYLYALSQSLPELPSRSYYGQAGIDGSLLEDYQLLQYDLLFGKGYLYQGNLPPIKQEGYFLGKEKMALESACVRERKKGHSSPWIVEATGKNFTSASQIYLNDKPLETEFEDENHLTAVVSEKVFNQPDEMTVQVKLTDSLDIIIAQTNCTILKKMLK